MDVPLSARNALTGAVADLQLWGEPAAAAGPALDAIRAAVGSPPDAALTVAGRRLPGDATLADCGLQPGMVVVAASPLPTPTPTPQLAVVVTAGPDAGRRHEVGVGRFVLGRSVDCDLTVEDPGLSRRHVQLDVDAAGIDLADLGTANGSWVGAAALGNRRIGRGELPVTLRLADSVVVLETPWRAGDRPVPELATRAGPRLAPPPGPSTIVLPAPPVTAPAGGVPVLGAAIPLVAGLVLALVLRQWELLAFTALSPLTVIGQALADRRRRRRTHRSATAAHAAALADAQRALDAALSEEVQRRHQEAPDIGALTAPAAAADGAVWQRRNGDGDLLRLRLGLGDQPSRVDVRGGPPAVVRRVPVVVALADIGDLGIAGPRARVLGLARGLVLQAAALHDPGTLRIVVLAPGGAADWGWVRWLPHVSGSTSCSATVGFDTDQVTARLAELRTPPAAGHTLVVVDGVPDPRYDELRPVAAVIHCGPEPRSLPPTCRAVASLTGGDPPRLALTTGGGHQAVAVPDLVARDVAEAAARRLAPLRAAAGGTTGLPDTVRWSDLNAGDLVRPWSDGPGTVIPLGARERGPLRLDLVRDGPHVLIAGTTGSGKSELLISLVASLAARNRPDRLSLLLIDHKGGAALGACADLPHTVGVVTDLDPASTDRALQSIAGELSRRERRLAAAGVADFAAYQHFGGDPMPRLVIVVDEFAALADGHGDAIAALASIAQRGRSLGIHLVLATQRPEGSVSADIRANLRVRICLGVAREQDSREVIDSPVAATISRATPGRGYLRIGPGELEQFQAARVTAPCEASRPISVTLLPDALLGDPPPRPAAAAVTATTELDALVQAAVAADGALGLPPPPRPWLPPLATRVTLSSLPGVCAARDVAWGLVDLPAEGRQPPLTADPDAGRVTLLIGTTRSGRTTAASSLAVAMAAARSPDRLQLWGIDGGAGLQPLASLPHCGAVIPAADAERVRRLLDHLSAEVRRRRAAPAAAHGALVLVVDGWEAVAGTAGERFGAEHADLLLRLAGDGPSANLHLVVTGGRGLLTSRLASIAEERIVLRLADPSDYLLFGLPRRDRPGTLPAGRGFRVSDHALVQIAMADAETLAVGRAQPPPAEPPARFAALPLTVTLAELRRRTPQPRAGSGDLITLGVDDAGPLPVHLARGELGPAFLIAGCRGAGRSTALRLIATQLSGRPVITVCGPSSPLAGCPGIVVAPPGDPAHALDLIDALTGNEAPAADVLIDDIDQLDDAALLSRIDELIRRPVGDRVIVLSATTESATAAFRGPLATARRSRQGLLLAPTSPRDGEVFGIDLRGSVLGSDPPGRGWLIGQSVTRRVQLALATDQCGSRGAR